MDLLLYFFEILLMWEVLLGLVVALVLTYVISLFIWGEFNFALMGGLGILFAILGGFVQYIVQDSKNRDR